MVDLHTLKVVLLKAV